MHNGDQTPATNGTRVSMMALWHSTDSTTHSTASANDIDNASATADGWASHEW